MITIDFTVTPYIIYIPQSYMTYTGDNVAGNPVYDLDMNSVHQDLRTLEASEEYVWCPQTHIHVPESDIDGDIFARQVLFQAPYLVELEAFAGVVNARGANHNMQSFLINTGAPAFNSNNSFGLIRARTDELQAAIDPHGKLRRQMILKRGAKFNTEVITPEEED